MAQETLMTGLPDKQPTLRVVPMPADPAAFAASLYATLHAVDRRSLDAIVVDAPPDDDAWLPVCDRLRRAAAGHVPPR